MTNKKELTKPFIRNVFDYKDDVVDHYYTHAKKSTSITYQVSHKMEYFSEGEEEQNYGVGIAAEPLGEYNSFSNVIIGVVNKESIANFKIGQANMYYFGKKFPSKYNIKNIQYFAPYFEGGVRGYYDVRSVRTALKSEILNISSSTEHDVRIILDLGTYHHISDVPKQVKLVYYTLAFMPLSELLEK